MSGFGDFHPLHRGHRELGGIPAVYLIDLPSSDVSVECHLTPPCHKLDFTDVGKGVRLP